MLLKKARDSFRGAKLLAGDGLHDFAASRAYYTMFSVAEVLLLGEELSFSKHTAVIAAFGRRFARTGTVPAEFHRYFVQLPHYSSLVGFLNPRNSEARLTIMLSCRRSDAREK